MCGVVCVVLCVCVVLWVCADIPPKDIRDWSRFIEGYSAELT